MKIRWAALEILRSDRRTDKHCDANVRVLETFRSESAQNERCKLHGILTSKVGNFIHGGLRVQFGGRLGRLQKSSRRDGVTLATD
jgi:hypothetical protein